MASGGADGGPSRPETAEIAPRSGRDAAVAIGRESNSTPIGMVRGVEEAALSACLGNTWAHGVNTRLILQCAPTDALGPGGRQLRVAKDASCADAVFEWAIPP